MSTNDEDVSVRNDNDSKEKEKEQSESPREVDTQLEPEPQNSEVKSVNLSTVLTQELWSDDASIVENALQDLAADTGEHKNTRKQALTMGALSTVLAVTKKWSDHQKIQSNAIDVLFDLTYDRGSRDIFSELGGIEQVVEALFICMEIRSAVENGLAILKDHLSDSVENVEKFMKHRAVELCEECLETYNYSCQADLFNGVYEILKVILQHNQFRREILLSDIVLQTCLRISVHGSPYPCKPIIEWNMLQVIKLLGKEDSFDLSSKVDALKLNGSVDESVDGTNDKEVKERDYANIAKMVTVDMWSDDPESVKKAVIYIKNRHRDEIFNFGGHMNTLAVMKKWNEQSEIQRSCLDILWKLCENDQTVSMTLVLADGIDIVLNAMKLNKQDTAACKVGFSITAALLSNTTLSNIKESAVTFGENGGVKLIGEVLEGLPYDDSQDYSASIHFAALNVMEAIAKHRDFRHPLFGEGVVPAIHKQVQKFGERDEEHSLEMHYSRLLRLLGSFGSDEESYWRMGKPCEENAENKEEEMDCKDDTENEETQ